MEIPAIISIKSDLVDSGNAREYVVTFADGDAYGFITQDIKEDMAAVIAAAICRRKSEMIDAKRSRQGEPVGTMLHQCHDIIFGDWKIKKYNTGWRLYAPDTYFNVAIAYCPFCGRRLPQAGEMLYRSPAPTDLSTVSHDGKMICWQEGNVNGQGPEGE
ncbi:hypothetical protein [Acetonema longum]|uniref:Uncharacterized protein n=1 Tax=Acetonema longum DSM 6540 TaxID=1009370 RepID=F7NK69_9FIRM|nr:hypothetical protein [Acetonema longum]EGO63510.1 hypothetical protein ALO_12411 [Acetonema longum DSM 6540]